MNQYIPGTMATILLVMAACGPIYSTEYTFTPPKGSSGSHCISLCEDQQNRCGEIESRRYDDCQARKERYYTECNDRIERDKGRVAKSSECGAIESCAENTSRCESLYHACYQSCGGKVVEDRHCIANCEGSGSHK